MKDDILVSICCITYNQEKYIKDAIDGFLMQKTNFKYEIIIHDDASTDNTANIIREYEKKYPDIIKPIYQTENQFSQGKKTSLIAYGIAKGKYIALCEGDDYWISENKLQKQVDYMEKHPDCSFCFHNANILYMRQMKTEKYLTKKSTYKKYISKDGNYDASTVHLVGMGAVPTASFLFKRENVSKMPPFFQNAICGDMPTKLIMTSFGYAHYIDEVLSVYRRETGMSLTDEWKREQQDNIEKKVNHIEELLKIIDNFDAFTDYKFKQGLDISRKMYYVEIEVIEGRYKNIAKNKELKKYYKIRYRDKFGIKLYAKAYFPVLYNFMKKIVGKNK